MYYCSPPCAGIAKSCRVAVISTEYCVSLCEWKKVHIYAYIQLIYTLHVCLKLCQATFIGVEW